MEILVDVADVSLKIHHRLILENISFKVARGEIVTIIGPNGGGKTALLKIILGLYSPTHGVVHRKPHLRIGYMPQAISVESLMPLNAARFLLLSPRADMTKCIKLAQELEITQLLESPIQTLSGGELQRVLLARALLNDPDLLVLDEPAQGVDINGQAALYQLISRVRANLGCGIVMVSHDLHLVIAGTDQVICLNRHICCGGTPGDVMQNPEFVHLFGQKIATEVALYTHNHDHHHDY